MTIKFVNQENQTAFINRYISRDKHVTFFANYGYYKCRSFGNLNDAKSFLFKKGFREA